MRKVSVLLVILLLFNLLVVGNVLADNICTISAGFNPSNLNPGKELKITISAKDITEGISAVSFTLDYDSSVFDFAGVEKKDGWTISQTETLYSIITDDYNATTTAGDIGVIKLKVKDDAKIGTTPVKLTTIEVAKEDASLISIGEISQNITIEKANTSSNNNSNNNSNITNTTNTTNNTQPVNTTNTTNTTKSTNNTNKNTTNTVSENSNKKSTNTINNENTNTAKSKNVVLPNTGNVAKGIGVVGILLVAIFSIISLTKFFKYKNI